ncbi:SRPBCC domain-containing protein [Streptomyces sp. NPDC019890]|uniref:SRPBCC domain-containing protein n=1 Tax=Streptomyces sp. NPDC019890 TaxID=3365064 RepID=UPI0038509C20
MEHEVFVPVAAETVRQALRDPARVARCVPGFQQDADASAGPLSGRLKLRIGGHTITYRGILRIVEQGEDFAAEGEGVEARGSGSAKVTLTIGLKPSDGGTTLTFTGTARSEGRLSELEPSATQSAARRLLDRAAESLSSTAGASDGAAGAGQPGAGDAAASGDAEGVDDAVASGDAEAAGANRSAAGSPGAVAPDDASPREGADAADASGAAGAPATAGGDASGGAGSADPAAARDAAEGEDAERPDATDDDAAAGLPAADAGGSEAEASPSGDPGAGERPDGAQPIADDAESAGGSEPAGSVFDAPVPAPSLDPLADAEFGGDEPPAEAAHARRTMIGRSAEEVDHAPPRGRYAPVPAPDAGSASATLRWIAPAAALALASAVVVGRVLRRRK